MDGCSTPRHLCIASASACMPLIGRTITIISAIRPSSSKRRMSTPCELAVADPRLEHQDRGVAGLDLLDVAEVLEDLDHRAEQELERVAALVGLEDDRAAEGRRPRRTAPRSARSPSPRQRPGRQSLFASLPQELLSRTVECQSTGPAGAARARRAGGRAAPGRRARPRSAFADRRRSRPPSPRASRPGPRSRCCRSRPAAPGSRRARRSSTRTSRPPARARRARWRGPGRGCCGSGRSARRRRGARARRRRTRRPGAGSPSRSCRRRRSPRSRPRPGARRSRTRARAAPRPRRGSRSWSRSRPRSAAPRRSRARSPARGPPATRRSSG